MGCYNDDVLFIHIPKCGGWAVKQYLKANLPGILLPADDASGLPIGHVRLADIERYTGRSPSSFKLILAVIRNPYEQQVSQACFWATRFCKGQMHLHDLATARHIRHERVKTDLMKAATNGGGFVWRPEHIDMTGFVTDVQCDFHVWYDREILKHASPEQGPAYINGVGFYRYWLDVDGAMPDNLHLIEQDALSESLPDLVREYATSADGLPAVEKLNTCSHAPAYGFYTPASAFIVEEKFPWAFENHYERMQWN